MKTSKIISPKAILRSLRNNVLRKSKAKAHSGSARLVAGGGNSLWFNLLNNFSDTAPRKIRPKCGPKRIVTLVSTIKGTRRYSVNYYPNKR